MKIIIRADSGSIVGSGHIMRCLVLADALGLPAMFACRDLPGNIISVITERGYQVEILSSDIEKANGQFLDFLQQQKADILIIDNYDTDIQLESKARQYVFRIAVIDDLANRKHDCDILIDQNPCEATHSRYKELASLSSIKLLGLKYALLGKGFSTHKKSIVSKEIKNILIFFGGGDHKNLTQKTIEALINNADYTDIKFNVVVGISNQNMEKISVLCAGNPNFHFHCQINKMAELMEQADLFIGAGGTTNWERMCIGLPGIIISIADNQIDSCNALVSFDVIKYLGVAEEFAPQKLLYSIDWIMQNRAWRETASMKSQEMVDGFGVKRSAANIKSLAISFTKATLSDCDNIYSWRNAEENRLYSINSDVIDFSAHHKWFSEIINNNNCNLLVASYENNPLGVVRFDYDNSKAEISLYLVSGLHGKGMGLSLLFGAEHWLREHRKDIMEISAKVLQNNIASVRIFEYTLYSLRQSDKNILLFNKRL